MPTSSTFSSATKSDQAVRKGATTMENGDALFYRWQEKSLLFPCLLSRGTIYTALNFGSALDLLLPDDDDDHDEKTARRRYLY